MRRGCGVKIDDFKLCWNSCYRFGFALAWGWLSTLAIVNLRRPDGTCHSNSSPTENPSMPEPIGERTEILLSVALAWSG